jgi:uncharacterized surface protein with fasciclin (FAS1) repeats
LISKSNHSKVFAHVVDQFDHVKEHLNSTKANFTVFVPTDGSFKKFKGHPKPPKEVLAKWLAYHVSPELHTSHSFATSIQTVPTFLKQENNGTNQQRVSVQRRLFGHVSVNFLAKVVKSDIVCPPFIQIPINPFINVGLIVENSSRRTA